jgi:PAS domain S-box-containing protein
MRKRVRDAYQSVDRSNRWHENLLASLTEGVFTVDHTGNLTSFSAGASRILGWSAEEVIGRSYSVVFSAPSPAPPNENSPLYTTPGTVTRQTTQTQGGDSVTLRVTSGERTQSSTGWEQAYVFRNVTEEEQAAGLREFLLANVSHEFKTPLAALHAAVELLATEWAALSQREIEQLLDAIQQGTMRLDELVENLLGSAGLQTGHFPVHLAATDLDEVIEEVLLTSRPLLALRGQYLKVDAPSPLRPVRADARRLHQVLTNLISNASKYGPVNSPVILAVEERERETVVRVTDAGAGVPAEQRPYLFRPFARLGTPDRNGIGLGLSIVKAIIERHGGRVGLHAAHSGGASFWFTLPVADEVEKREPVHEDSAGGR